MGSTPSAERRTRRDRGGRPLPVAVLPMFALVLTEPEFSQRRAPGSMRAGDVVASAREHDVVDPADRREPGRAGPLVGDREDRPGHPQRRLWTDRQPSNAALAQAVE